MMPCYFDGDALPAYDDACIKVDLAGLELGQRWLLFFFIRIVVLSHIHAIHSFVIAIVSLVQGAIQRHQTGPGFYVDTTSVQLHLCNVQEDHSRTGRCQSGRRIEAFIMKWFDMSYLIQTVN